MFQYFVKIHNDFDLESVEWNDITDYGFVYNLIFDNTRSQK